MNMSIKHAAAIGLLMTGCSKPAHQDIHRSEPAAVSGADMGYPEPTLIRSNHATPQFVSGPVPTAYSSDDVTIEQLREYVRSGSAVIVDARSPDQFAAGHVRGAMNIPSERPA